MKTIVVECTSIICVISLCRQISLIVRNLELGAGFLSWTSNNNSTVLKGKNVEISASDFSGKTEEGTNAKQHRG